MRESWTTWIATAALRLWTRSSTWASPKWDSGCWIRYKLFENCIDDAPTLSPDEVRGVGCAYCKEDRDGYTMPLEKNAHAWVQYPNKLVIQFGKEIRKCEIKYCPMCGARMKGAEDGTTDTEKY